MHKKIVDISLKYRFLVILGIFIVIGLGLFQYKNLPIDAFPDISPIMVPVFAEAHGMAPEEVERLITFPIESAMNGLPGVTQIKSTSAGGMAVIYVYFDDKTDIYFARQIVAERLNRAMADLPEMHDPPKLGPISTGLGQIFMYYLTLDEGTDTEGKASDIYLREINDWIVKYQLQTVPGVTEILSMGGHVLQYQIQINPLSLSKFNISLEEIVEAVRENNRNAGGSFLVIGNEELTVRGIGLLQNLDDIRNVQIKVIDGNPIRVADVADVNYGREVRRGVVSHNGKEEVVAGIVLQLYGQNTMKVIDRLYKKIPEVQASLPKGVHLVPYYEQADLVESATHTVKVALLEGGILVIIVLILFLGNFRAAFIVSLALPLSALIAIIFMRQAGISANLMSLGGIAIAIGMLGDGSVVMVENIFRHLGCDNLRAGRDKNDIILDAAREVSKPIIFSILIIITVFLPIFTLQGVEGKMFSPMAFTLCFALLGSLIAAIVVAPSLCTYLLKADKHKEFFVVRLIKRFYKPLLKIAVKLKVLLLIVVIIVFVAAIALVSKLGTEFIPTLEEGSVLIGINMAPSISLEKATETIQNIERKILEFDIVDEVISRIGRPEAGSHPHPVNIAEIHIEFKDKKEWKSFKTKKEFIEALNKKFEPILGVQFNFSQPIQNAFNELLSGAKTQLAIKIFGEDLTVLSKKANEIRTAIDKVPGLVDLSVEQSFGQPQIQIIADREACARFGVDVNEILELVELAVGGEAIDNIFLNTRRFDIHVRYQEKFRNDPEAIKKLLVHNKTGALIPLEQVADIKQILGPIQINREKNQRRWSVFGNVRGRDMGSVVADIKNKISENVTLPPGYYIEFGGQFENQQRAMTRLYIIVPIVIALVFLMLSFAFGSIKNALLIILNVPIALIGGILGLFIVGEYLSVPAVVGFIALFGIAVQNGMVLVSCFNELIENGMDVKEAIITGCMQRVRPVLMTAMTTIIGLFPLLFATGIGSEVQRPLAIVVVCGLASATILTLFVVPAFFQWFSNSKLQNKNS
jgi:cobalt-zinc-cadmium resistance protein CzcA